MELVYDCEGTRVYGSDQSLMFYANFVEDWVTPVLSDTITDSRRAAMEVENENLELQTWSDLPTELLELILSRLSLDDNIRASVVCKRWHSAATSVCVVNQSPWLMYFPKFGDWYEFYDPVQRKTYSIELPELSGSRVCYTKDGWLLLYRPRTHRMFFFNPFTQEIIKLPRFEMSYQIVAFSCAPTSSDCVLFTVKHVSPTVVAISTCYPGATEWTTVSYQNRLPFVSSIWNKLVFCNGIFYCLSLTGWLGVFDSSERTWSVLSVPPPKCPKNFFAKNWWKGKFMTEHEGDIITLMEWEEMTTLDGITLFASFLSSHSRTDLSGIMRNSVYFSKFLREAHLKACRRQRLYYVGGFYDVKNHICWGMLRLNPFDYLVSADLE
ncbi:F-box protein, partial [Mucuna pruriens]